MNVLHYGDNLPLLRAMPSNEVDLVYLDPPFNSKKAYNAFLKNESGQVSQAQIGAFDDTWTWGPEPEAEYLAMLQGGVPDQVATSIKAMHDVLPARTDLLAYLVMMTPRLVQLHRVLKPSAALYLHCDPTASHYLKLILDSVFGPKCFRNEIVWRRSRGHHDRKIRRFGAIHDSILFYTKGDGWIFNPEYSERDDDAPKTHDLYRHTDGKLYRKDNCMAPGGRGPKYEWNGHTRHWRFSPEERDRLISEGKIVHSKNGMPRVLRPVDLAKGAPMQDLWIDIDAPNSGSDELLGYPTQKPLTLLERIIKASSNEGDVVLDPFCGCGTAVDAAERLKRKWIGIDISYLAIDLITKRLTAAHGKKLGKIEVRGVPTDMEGAKALFRQNTLDFERWAVSLVEGEPNDKQVGDKGIDGVVRFPAEGSNVGRALVSVKGGEQINPSMVRDLVGTVQSQKAEMGVLVLLEEPTRGMVSAANGAGLYEIKVLRRSFQKIQIITVSELLSGGRPKMPTPFLPFIKARQYPGRQLALLPT